MYICFNNDSELETLHGFLKIYLLNSSLDPTHNPQYVTSDMQY